MDTAAIAGRENMPYLKALKTPLLAVELARQVVLLVEEELDADHLWLGSPEATGEGHLCRGVGAQAQRGQ